MPRAIWSGSISFGLVAIPVKLFNGVSRKSVSFNQIDAETGARVRQRLVSAADGSEVSRDRLVKGYAVSKDNYVTVTPEDFASIMPVQQRTIDLEEFVDESEIDPIYYDSAYYLIPDPIATKPYALLTAAMERSDKVGIARFVMRSKQYLGAIRVSQGMLVLSTMVYADEINDVDEFDEVDKVAGVELTERELTMADQLITSLAAEFDPEKYRDTYREQLLELIERKVAGQVEPLVSAPAADTDDVVDLMAALEASVAEAKEARKRHPSARDVSEKRPAKKKRTVRKSA